MAVDAEERREEFGPWLRRQREEKGYGIDRAARVSGVAATTLRRIEMGDVPSIEVARQIAHGLELELADVFRRVGYPLGLWNDRRRGKGAGRSLMAEEKAVTADRSEPGV